MEGIAIQSHQNDAVVNSTISRSDCRITSKTDLTEKSSRQNIKLMIGVAIGPKAFRPMSEYVRIRGSARMRRTSILALHKGSKARKMYKRSHSRMTSHETIRDNKNGAHDPPGIHKC